MKGLAEAKKILESASEELESYIDAKNAELKANIKSTDLDDPDYHDYQTCWELMNIARRISGIIDN